LSVKSLLTDVLANHLILDEIVPLEAPSISMQVRKLRGQSLPSDIQLKSGKFQVPSFCTMLNQKPFKETPMYNLADEMNCTERILVVQVCRVFKIALNIFNRIELIVITDLI
jgi:hypothetical protein